MSILLPYFMQSFITIPWMESFYIGYNDGSFYMVQAIRGNKKIQQATSAPDQAAYTMKTIPPGMGNNKQVQFSFFDSELTLLETRKEDFDGYDPRKREWYKAAISKNRIEITKPYLFFTTQQIGVTMAHSLRQGTGVVGADSVLTAIAGLLRKHKITPSTQIVLLDSRGQLILSADDADLTRLQESRKSDQDGMLHVQDLENQAASLLYKKSIAENQEGGHVVEIGDEKWFGHVRQMGGENNSGICIVIGAPFEELMVNAQTTRQRNFLIMFSVMVAALGFGIYFSRRIAEPLHDLSIQAENVRNFKLTTPLTIKSRICEVDDLAASMTVMQKAINRFVEIARALSAEKRMDKVLEMIVQEAQSVAGADGGGIGLVSDDGKSFSYVLIHNTKSGVHLGDSEIPVDQIILENDTSRNPSLEAAVVQSGQTRVIDDLPPFRTDMASPVMQLHEKQGYTCHSLLMIPLLNRQDEVIGLLHLVNAREEESGEITNFSEDKTAYVTALASNAALALDNNRLIRAQKDLFDSFVRLIAGAIDTKSPYTGGHCQRVPVLAAEQ